MNCIQASFSVPYQFPILFIDQFKGNEFSALSQLNLNSPDVKLLILVEQKVDESFPLLASELDTFLASMPFKQQLYRVLPGAEACKNAEHLITDILDLTVTHKIDRHSYILAIGGGAFIDMVGYAATIAHRGINLIRMPTTVLGQNDAGIGVKNAVNYKGRKNYVGTFATPSIVVNNYQFIHTLGERDKRSGIAEAIKVALIKDKTFYCELAANAAKLGRFEDTAMKNMIFQCAKLHVEHICTNGDPFERGSARPLDFGHWFAHALEEQCQFELRHGEAVAVGILIDSYYSWRKGWIAQQDYFSIRDTLLSIGFTFDHPSIKQVDVTSALEKFREHLGGQLCITMLADIGHGVEVNEIDIQLVNDAIESILVEEEHCA